MSKAATAKSLCKGLAPVPGRLVANQQRCGALPAPGHDYCAVHEKLLGCCVNCGTPQHTCFGYKAGAMKCCPECQHPPIPVRKR